MVGSSPILRDLHDFGASGKFRGCTLLRKVGALVARRRDAMLRSSSSGSSTERPGSPVKALGMSVRQRKTSGMPLLWQDCVFLAMFRDVEREKLLKLSESDTQAQARDIHIVYRLVFSPPHHPALQPLRSVACL